MHAPYIVHMSRVFVRILSMVDLRDRGEFSILADFLIEEGKLE
jgi:hypothetical protein